MDKLAGHNNFTHGIDSSEDILRKEIHRLQEENRMLRSLLDKEPKSDSRSSQVPLSPDLARYMSPLAFQYTFFDKLPHLAWIKDTEGRYLAVNNSYKTVFEKDKEEFIGLTDHELFPYAFSEKFRNDDLLVMKTGEQKVFEEIIPTGKGDIWYETIKVPLFNEEGKAFGVAGFARDISTRKEYENILRESEEKFRELAENTSDAFIIKSGKSIIYVNPAFEKIFGYPRDRCMKDPDLPFRCIYHKDAGRIEKILKSPSYRSSLLFDQQYRIRRSDDTVNWIWHRSYPVWNEKGEAYRLVSVITDISAIKNLEETLRRSKIQQQAILDNIPHLAWLKDTNCVYISANEAFCRFFDLTPEQIAGKTDHDLVSKPFADDYVRKDKMVMDGRKSKLFYEVEEGRFGKRYSETHKTPVLNDLGEVIGIAGISRDITEQKLAEQALLRSEEKYKDIVTLLPEIVFETDANGKLTFVNLKAIEVTKYTPQDLDKGLFVFDIIVPEERERLKDAMHKLSRGAELRGNEYTLLARDGRRIPVMSFTNSMFSEGKFTGIRGVVVDISKKKISEESEKEYQKKLLYLSQTALGFLELPGDKDLYAYIGQKLKEFIGETDVIVNRFEDETSRMWLQYTSFTPEVLAELESLTGTEPDKVNFRIDPDKLLDFSGHTEKLIHFSEGLFESSFNQIPRPVTLQMERVMQMRKLYGIALMKSGKLYGTVLLIVKSEELRDQTFIETFIYQASIALHRRQLEAELIDARNKAEESGKLKTAFLANMSHEIRTPMNGILGLTQLLLKNEFELKERREYLNMINVNGKLLLDLVSDILDISRIESNQLVLNEETFGLKALMSELECFILAEKMVKDLETIELSSQLGAYTDLVIHCDKAKIRQVFINLIGNAIKFTRSGKIEFGVESVVDNTLMFYVRDTGIGIPYSKINVIFDRFTQVDQSLTRPYGGSGLGLAICKGFIERMGGKIWVESEEGKGSTFRFTAPYKPIDTDTARKEIAPKHSFSIDWSDLTLLVVEDNYVSYKLLEASMHKTGVHIIHVEDGLEAIRMVREHPEIDLVLMDIQLPVMNGYDATREIVLLRPELPVVAQTANAMDEDRLKCLNAGCCDYITKPIQLEKLFRILEDHLPRRNA